MLRVSFDVLCCSLLTYSTLAYAVLLSQEKGAHLLADTSITTATSQCTAGLALFVEGTMTTRRSQIAGKASFKLAVTSLAPLEIVMLTCIHLCGGFKISVETSNSRFCMQLPLVFAWQVCSGHGTPTGSRAAARWS